MSETRPGKKKPSTKTSMMTKSATRPKTRKASPASEPMSDQMLDRLIDLSDDCADVAAELDKATSAESADDAVAAIGAASVWLDRLVRGMASLCSALDPQAFEAARHAARALPAVAAPSSPQ
jgi:hypothetical protein